MGDTAITWNAVVLIAETTANERAWLEEAFDAFDTAPWTEAGELEGLSHELLTEVRGLITDDSLFWGFGLHTDEESRKSRIFASGDEAINLEGVCDFLGLFLKTFREDQALAFTWGCVDTGTGEGGGGAAVVTATNIFMVSTSQIVEQRLKDMGVIDG